MKTKYTRFAILFIVLASLPFYAGCESDILPGTIALSVIKGEDGIIPNEKDFATIEATVTDDAGDPIGLGMEIDFETTEGIFSNYRQSISLRTTDTSGKVRAYLFALKGTDAPTTAVVTGSAQDSSRSVHIPILGCDPDRDVAKIALVASPDTIPADGETSSKITATVTNCDGDGVFPAEVEYRTDKGLFSNGKRTIIKTTRDSTGTVDAFLIALEGTPLGPAKIEVRSKDEPDIIAVVTVNIGARPAGIVLVADPTSIPADGRTASTITATVTDYQGTVVPPGTAVTFETVVGRFSHGSNSITVTTDSSGKAVAHFFAPVGTEPQLVQITAMSMGVSARVVVTITEPSASPTPTPTPTPSPT